MDVAVNLQIDEQKEEKRIPSEIILSQDHDHEDIQESRERIEMVAQEISLGIGLTELFRVYRFDYLVLFLVSLFIPVVRYLFPTFQRERPESFPMIEYPFTKDETVSSVGLLVLAVVIPFLVFGVVHFIRRDIHLLHHMSLGLFVGFSFTSLFTEAMKHQGGRYRPDYLDRLASGDPSLIERGHWSFPSGHSSTAFVSFTYLSLIISSQFRLYHPNNGHLWQFVVSLIPITLACFVAISRTNDYRHNFSDIIAGAMVGTPFAFASYLLYFPSLLDPNCDVPKMRKIMETSFL